MMRFGLIPEFVGRFPVLVPLHALTEQDLVRVLTEPRNSLVRQFSKLFAFNGAQLRFEPAALRAVAREALRRGTGARGLRSIMEKLLTDAQFEVPDASPPVEAVVVDERSVQAGLKARAARAPLAMCPSCDCAAREAALPAGLLM